MRKRRLETSVSLQPGLLSEEMVLELLVLILERFAWFEPKRYGTASLSNKFPPGKLDFTALLDHYKENACLCVAAKTDESLIWILPSRTREFPFTGKLTWLSSTKPSSKDSWRLAHAEQVSELMRLLDSPLAYSAQEDDLESKAWRLVDKAGYQELTFTVRDYSEGLAGLFWRNFYGPPFVRMFAERLNTLPPECVTRLDEELVLVQPYELPTEAGTEQASARERHLISLLGPECFYDHEHHQLPSRRPVLDSRPLP